MSSDACFMGMPSRVGPVAILGLWAAMVDGCSACRVTLGVWCLLRPKKKKKCRTRVVECWYSPASSNLAGRMWSRVLRKGPFPDVTDTKLRSNPMQGRVRLSSQLLQGQGGAAAA